MLKKFKMSNRILTLMMSVFLLMGFLCPSVMAKTDKPVAFGDYGWDSIQIHNRIAAFIITHGLGYNTKFVQGETIMLNTALIKSKGTEAPHVNMESWTDNWQELYDEGLAKGQDSDTDEGFINLGANFPNSIQGWYVPTYMIKGDPERGIEASTPNLKSVYDLPEYWKYFKDPEDPSKGRFFTCIPGWACAKVNEKKFEAYDLKKHYNIIEPGSGAALAASMEAAYKRGKPWLGYYWAPTWVLGKLDMTQLEEPAYDKEIFETTGGCAYPSVRCDILVHKNLPEWAPEVVAFLKNYETTLQLTNTMLAHMQDVKASTQETAEWFLKNYESLWTPWVTSDVAAKVKAALR